MAKICVSTQARTLLCALLAAQCRSLLSHDQHADGSSRLADSRECARPANTSRRRRSNYAPCAPRCLRWRLGLALQVVARTVSSGRGNKKSGNDGSTSLAWRRSSRASAERFGACMHVSVPTTAIWRWRLSSPTPRPRTRTSTTRFREAPIVWWEPLALRSEVNWEPCGLWPRKADQIVSTNSSASSVYLHLRTRSAQDCRGWQGSCSRIRRARPAVLG